MALSHVLADLDRLAVDSRTEGRDSFSSFGGFIINHGGLDTAETDAAYRRLGELSLSLPVVQLTEKQFNEAGSICRTAAARLTAGGWYREVIDTWPAPIAHELAALAGALRGWGGQAPSPEAALLQLRDLSETLVKFPAVILARRLVDLGGEDAQEMRTRLARLRGGEWNALAREAAKRLTRAEPGSKLAPVAALVGDGSQYAALLDRLTTARNDAIGHGAMRRNPAETASLVSWFVAAQRGDPQPSGPRGKIPAGPTIATTLEAVAGLKPWTGLHLGAESPDGVIDLTGAESLRRWHGDAVHRHHADQTLPISLSIDGAPGLRLSPLLGARICRDCGTRDVFFFDSVYRHGPWRLDFLDYGRGHKSRLDGASAADLLEELRPDPPGPGELEVGSLDTRSAVLALEAMRIDHRYRSPGWLREPFAAFLAEHDRGVYWLQAPAHVGKTMFTLGLTTAGLEDEPIAPFFAPGSGIAAFLCKREYREGWVTVLNALSTSLKVVLDLGDQNQFPTVEAVVKAADPRAAFLRWLQSWRALAQPSGRRLLVVIDGLDETDPPDRQSLLNLLPRAADLPEGLYMLLTSRAVTDKDCPDWLGPTLAPLVAGEHAQTRVVGLEDSGYRALMAEYAQHRLGLDRSPATTASIEAMIERSEGRFVFLSFLVEQRRFLGRESGTGSGSGLYEAFLDGLEPRYGAKRAESLVSLLATLTAVEGAHAWTFGLGAQPDLATGGTLEPMSREFLGLELETLAVVTGMDEAGSGGRRLTFAFVEALMLLQGTLWVWRGQSGVPRYRLGLKEFAAVLEQLQPDALARARARVAGLTLDTLETLAPILDDGDEPDKAAEHLLKELFPFLPGMVAQAGSDLLTYRFQAVPVGDVALNLEARHGSARAPSVEQVRWYSALLCSYGRGCGPADADDQRRNNLAAVYMNRGNVKQDAPGFGPGAAIADYDAAIGVMEALRDGLGEGWPVPWRNDLAGAYVNRGNAKQSAPGFGPGAAIADYDAAIEVLEAVQGNLGAQFPPGWADRLARARAQREKVAGGSQGGDLERRWSVSRLLSLFNKWR